MPRVRFPSVWRPQVQAGGALPAACSEEEELVPLQVPSDGRTPLDAYAALAVGARAAARAAEEEEESIFPPMTVLITSAAEAAEEAWAARQEIQRWFTKNNRLPLGLRYAAVHGEASESEADGAEAATEDETATDEDAATADDAVERGAKRPRFESSDGRCRARDQEAAIDSAALEAALDSTCHMMDRLVYAASLVDASRPASLSLLAVAAFAEVRGLRIRVLDMTPPPASPSRTAPSKQPLMNAADPAGLRRLTTVGPKRGLPVVLALGEHGSCAALVAASTARRCKMATVTTLRS